MKFFTPVTKSFQVARLTYWSRQHPILAGGIAALVTWLITQVISGIVGNSAYDYFRSIIFPWLQESATSSRLSLLLVGAGVLAIGLFFFNVVFTKTWLPASSLNISDLNRFSILVNRNQEAIFLTILKDINAHLQKSLLIDNPNQVDAFVHQFFSIIFEGFGPEEVNGGGILLPKDDDSGILYFWKMSPDQLLSPKQFHIGKNAQGEKRNKPKGVAGNVFLNGKPEIVNILDARKGKADNPNFVNFDTKALNYPRTITPYSSFICLPIRLHGNVVGVLSIESQIKNTFNNEIAKCLQPVADLLGTALFIHEVINIDNSVKMK